MSIINIINYINNSMYILLILIFFWNLIIIFFKKKKYRKKVKEKIKVFNLGSSHSYFSFNYENEKCQNFADISQTFYFDYIILKKYFDRLMKNGYCFLVISYFSFASKEYWVEEDLIKYYKFLDVSKFKGKYKLEYIIFNYLPLFWSIRKKINKRKKKNINLKSDNRLKGQVKKLEENKMLNYNIELIEKIIKKCNEKSIKVILLTTPFTKYYNNFFSDDLLNKSFYSEIEKIREKYSLLYFDFSHDYINFNKEEYFADYDHVSEKGSKIFMKVLEKNLIENNIKIDL